MLGMLAANAPDMTLQETRLWRDYVGRRCGLTFSDSRCRLLRQSLWQRMCALGTKSYTDYYHRVTFRPEGDWEWRLLLELLLNNETSFFRHAPSFAALTAHVLPELVASRANQPEPGLDLWSAGCSTGQEPYSLAMTVLGCVDVGRWRVRIHASDISPRVLERGRRGRFTPLEVRSLPEAYQARYLRPAAGAPHLFEVADEVRRLTRFGPVNLMDAGSYPSSGQDVIFCHNVLIYFPPEARVEVVLRLADQLNPGGYLCLGPADSVGIPATGLRAVRLEDVLLFRRPPERSDITGTSHGS